MLAVLCCVEGLISSQEVFVFFRREERFFFSLNRGGEGGGGEKRQTGPLVEGGSISGRISICKQSAAHS